MFAQIFKTPKTMKKVLLLLLSISLFSCGGDDSSPAPTPTTTDVAYFRANLNGSPLDYTQNSSFAPAYYNSLGTGFSGNGFDRSHYYASDMVPGSGADYPQIGITYHNMYVTNDSSTESAAFYGLFSPAPTNFITDTQEDNWEKGVEVGYYKADGTYYSTLKGSQSGSTITVTSKKETISRGLGGDVRFVKLTGTVNCKLYDYWNPSADPIVLTNGKFKLQFSEYLD